jgi:hypothetical protein
VALARRSARWRADGVHADGTPAHRGTRFNDATVSAFEAMLRDNGWRFDELSEPCPWRCDDPSADMSTFVRAVRLTLRALAGEDCVDGIAPLSEMLS